MSASFTASIGHIGLRTATDRRVVGIGVYHEDRFGLKTMDEHFNAKNDSDLKSNKRNQKICKI